MKRLEDIENLSLEELERISDDKSVKVPEGVSASLEDAVAATAVAEQGTAGSVRRPVAGYALGGVLAAAVAGLAIVLSLPRAPKDTFDDPLMAYAELEKTFSYISSKVDRGLELAAEAEPAFEKTAGTLNKTIKNK